MNLNNEEIKNWRSNLKSPRGLKIGFHIFVWNNKDVRHTNWYINFMVTRNTLNYVYRVGYIDLAKFLMYSVRGFQLFNIDPFRRCSPKFQLEIRTVTAWIFSESTTTSICFPIQISKSIFLQTKANIMEQMHENCKLWHNLSTFGRIQA
jgi:hypothetical protein